MRIAAPPADRRGPRDLLCLPQGERIAGLIVLVPEPVVLLVENVAVDPLFQGRGPGRTLLAHAEVTAREAGLPSLRLYTHRPMTANIALYEALGYTVTAPDTKDDPRDPYGQDPLGHPRQRTTGRVGKS